MQRQRRAAVGTGQGGVRLNGIVVGSDHGDLAVADPLQQLLVAAVEHCAAVVQHHRVGILLHRQHGLGKAGVQAEHVAGLDLQPVGLDHAHPLVVADQGAGIAVVRMQVHHHAPALHAVLGHALNTQRLGAAGAAAAFGRGHAGVAHQEWAQHIAACGIAVVVERLRHAIAIRIKQLAGMGQAIPLGGVLQRQHGHVVGQHIGAARFQVAQQAVEVDQALALQGAQHGWLAVGVEGAAARVVQRQAERKAQAFLHLGHALAHLGWRQQVEAAQLVIGAEVAPGRSCRALLPAWIGVGHACLLG